MKSTKRTPARFYQQDIVQRITSPRSYGIVLRCWHDAEDMPPNPLDPLMRPLNHGEVGVSFLADGGSREILPESALRLVDRTLNPGDYCKRNIDDVHSGVVTNLHVRGRIEHAITGEQVEEWWTANDLERKADAEIGDHVVYDDWIGQVIEVFDESVVEIADGQLVRVPELGSRLNVGERGSDILPPPTGSMHNLFGFLLGGHRSNSSDMVVAVKHSVYAIAWLALNQSLSPAIAEQKRRPQRFWAAKDISKLTLVRGRSDLEMRVGDRVRLKDTLGKPVSKHGQDGDSTGTITVQTFVVTETETVLDILWQDGSRETLKSTDVIPYLNPDEYDCWPGDHVLWKNEEGKRPAIVQSVNAVDRTAVILLIDVKMLETVSVLELDPHGAPDQNGSVAQSVSDGFGVRRSDFVFIHPEGKTNGFEVPYVPRIGELEGWIHESPFLECHLTGWRKEMSELGANIAARQSVVSPDEDSMVIPNADDGGLSWIGEVTGLNLDGTVEVTHPDLTTKTYPLQRLTRLYDGIEQLEDQAWADETSDGHGSFDEQEEVWAMNEDGTWQVDLSNDRDWQDEDDDSYHGDTHENMEVDEWTYGQYKRPSMEQENCMTSLPPIVPPIETRSSSMNGTISSDEEQISKHIEPDASVEDVAKPEGTDGGSWKRFDVLPSAPVDHAFYSTPPASPSKSFLTRLHREYRALASSLPESIAVRAYEDRGDLLRSLIIGPENTPYEDAPFVIDWMLDSNFPYSPPIAHFLSWTNGNGRVNPNLYEEGKVCLSILGTWAGDRNEIWSAARSSLLQAFVSIQGLVLVKEPWFCEPAYEKLRGTEEGIVNSRLYSEKAYVLSRGFVRRALEIPLGSLESDIRWLYYTRGRLDKVLRDARKLVQKSKTSSDTSDLDCELAVPRLTTGGIITLERTLTKLQELLDAYRNAPSQHDFLYL
ncbi:hypothetical protein AX17_000554 [Amanita inopinata Kibby_2008]|nr:hypothetical protein AX17_000554 [Amanita inopinata Kibby_2008]